jgi:hypothetical protein|nr:MAG TPA: hypothetical protein [Caudoviricetes sp.]
MKYKVGDKVRIREDLVTGGNYGGSVAVDDMVDMGGNVVTIERVGNLGYYIEEDPDGYCWTDEMFEPVEEMSAIEALEILAEICMKQYTCSKCPIQCIDRQKICVSIRKENPTDVVKVLEQWKADHEKKPIETELACVVRVIEDTGKVKRCVYEEDVTEEKGEKIGIVMKRILEEYCKEHEGKFFTVYEEICRVKE